MAGPGLTLDRVRIRLESVATRAGVSPASVSRVVNGRPRVSEQTRRAAFAAVEPLGHDGLPVLFQTELVVRRSTGPPLAPRS